MPSARSIASVGMLIASMSGCVSMPDYEHYGQVVDYYAMTERYKVVSFSIDADRVSTVTGEGLADELTSYLSFYGIDVSKDEATSEAHIELTVSDASVGATSALNSGGINIRGAAGRFPISATARVIVNGSLVHQADLYYIAWSPLREIREQQLASMIADDLLLIWHPRSSADWLKKKSNGPAPFALMQDSVDAQTHEGRSTFRWEGFPSARMLRETGLATADISNVSYEFRLQQIALKEYAFSLYPQYSRPLLFRQGDIPENHFAPPFVMPSCGDLIWAVRAHFNLNGYPRATEWSGSYYNSLGMVITTVVSKSTLPPHIYRRSQSTKGWQTFAGTDELMHHSRIGTIAKVVPPNGIDCASLDWGPLNRPRQRADGDFGAHIRPLEQGDAIVARAVITRRCQAAECDFEEGVQDASNTMASCLAREFRRGSTEIPVLAATDVENLPRNVRYILDTDISIVKGGTTTQGEANFGAIVTNKETSYSATFEVNVVDAESGEVIGTIDAAHTGSKGRVAGFFLVLPMVYIPYGSVGGIQDEACDQLARYASFALRGGITTEWPDQYFKTEMDALW